MVTQTHPRIREVTASPLGSHTVTFTFESTNYVIVDLTITHPIVNIYDLCVYDVIDANGDKLSFASEQDADFR